MTLPINSRNFLRNSSAKAAEERVAYREAMVFSYDENTRLAAVKFQGCEHLVYVRYPMNIDNKPFYLKVGMSVKVGHSRGIRQLMEIIGYGRVMPTAIGTTAYPTIAAGPDAVLTGLNLLPNKPTADMGVFISPGTFRIDNTEYSSLGIVMGNSNIVMGDNPIVMGQYAEYVTFTAPAAGYYRYDIVVIGADSVIDVVQGTAATTSPTIPLTPSGHVLLGYVRLYGGQTQITYSDISKDHTTAVISTILLSVDDDDLDWGVNSCTLTIATKDQDGVAKASAARVLLEIVHGNGTLSKGSQSGTSIEVEMNNLASATATYTRVGDITDNSPTIKATFLLNRALTSTIFIILRDEAGLIMAS